MEKATVEKASEKLSEKRASSGWLTKNPMLGDDLVRFRKVARERENCMPN